MNKDIFPEKIKEVRMAHFYSRKELGELLGITEQTIYLYEKGKRYPRMTILRNISHLAKEKNIDF